MAKSSASGERLLLAVDISNTGIKFGLYPRDGDGLRARWRIATSARSTADEYAMVLAALPAGRPAPRSD